LKLKTSAIVIIGAILCASTAVWATTNNTNIPSEIIKHYNEGAEGDSNANEKAFEALSELRKKHPDDALIMTILGSSEAIKARDSFIPWRQLRYIESGMAHIDKGVSMIKPSDSRKTFEDVPISLWIKNTAGCTFVEVPKMFNRYEMGYALLEEALTSAEVSSLPFDKKASTYLCAGLGAKLMDDKKKAREYFQLIISKAPNSEEAKRAKKLLKKVK